MPYRLNGNCVEQKKDGKWVEKKCYGARKDALAYFEALKINVTKEYTDLVRTAIKDFFDKKD